VVAAVGGKRICLRLADGYVGAEDFEVAMGRFESLFGVVMRNESGVVVQSEVALPAEPVEDCQQ
jgi:hypothetical protein